MEDKVKQELLLTPEERLNAEDEALKFLHLQGKVVSKDGFGRRDITYAVRMVVAQAQLAKAEPLIRKAVEEESEARLELIRRLTARCEQLMKEIELTRKDERERIFSEINARNLYIVTKDCGNPTEDDWQALKSS